MRRHRILFGFLTERHFKTIFFTIMMSLETLLGANPSFHTWGIDQQLTYIESVIKGEVPKYSMGGVIVNEWNLESRYKNLEYYTSHLEVPTCHHHRERIEHCRELIKKQLNGYLGGVVRRSDRALSIADVDAVLLHLGSALTKKDTEIRKPSFMQRVVKHAAHYLAAITIGTTLLTGTFTAAYDATVVEEITFPYLPTMNTEEVVFDINISKHELRVLQYDNNHWFEKESFSVAVPENILPKIEVGDGGTAYGMYRITSVEDSSHWFFEGRPGAYGDSFLRLNVGATIDNPRGAGIGIHGTDQPDTVGTPASQGCFRMHNDELKKLLPYADAGMYVRIY